jgi:hypothetical protein
MREAANKNNMPHGQQFYLLLSAPLPTMQHVGISVFEDIK